MGSFYKVAGVSGEVGGLWRLSVPMELLRVVAVHVHGELLGLSVANCAIGQWGDV